MKLILFLLLPLFSTQPKPLKYEWRKISGPAQYRIVSPGSAVTDITDLVAGVYQFELKVTSSNGLSSRDTMVLTVNPPVNKVVAKSTAKSIKFFN